MIEAAYAQTVLPVWTEDEAGPYPTLPYPGMHWRPMAEPVRYPHEYLRTGTAKQLTLFHPASGAVRVKGVRSCTNAVLHPWLEAELYTILATLPEPTETLSAAANQRCWARWQEGLSIRITLPECLPPLRMLLVLDNLTGHHTPAFVLWLFAHGIMPLDTPLGGSWLNLPKGHPPSPSSAFSNGGRWMGTTRRRRRKSSPGWKRLLTDGIEHRRRLSGAGNGRRGANAGERAAMRSADQARVRRYRFTGSGQHEDMAMSNATDPLVADFYLDHNVSSMLGTLLRRRGHSVVSAREIGQERGDDAEHLFIAAQQQRIVVTHDREDFTLLHRAWLRWSAGWHVSASHSGILIIPQPPRLTVVQSDRAIDALIAQQPTMISTLFVWTTSMGWSNSISQGRSLT